jgi:hypothetical protein
LLPGEKPGSFGSLPLQPGSELARWAMSIFQHGYRDICQASIRGCAGCVTGSSRMPAF